LTDIKVIKLSPEEIRRRLELEAKKFTPGHAWENWEDDLLREFKPRLPSRIVAKLLSVTTCQVEHRYNVLGLREKASSVQAHVKPTLRRGRR
jgi:hypothetical protein